MSAAEVRTVRFGWIGWLAWGLACMSLLGCVRSDGDGSPPDDRLVFELGGDGPPLSVLLRARAPGSRPQVEVPKPDPAALGGLPPATRIAVLQAGETLGGLCERELGSSAGWREVAELNGWSEADVHVLPVGARVRLPIR